MAILFSMYFNVLELQSLMIEYKKTHNFTIVLINLFSVYQMQLINTSEEHYTMQKTIFLNVLQLRK